MRHKELSAQHFTRPLRSVYLGGGTPSLLSAAQINSFLQGLWLDETCEITLEVNPITITKSYVESLNTTAVNRLSLGVQSLMDHELSYLGRKHKAADIEPRIRLLRDGGYHNLSADLIYGIPRSTLQDVEHSLKAIAQLPLEHISTYLLEIEESSPLAKDSALIPEDALLEEMYHLIRERLEDSGFDQYEISNFARKGKSSRHNLLYWQDGDYLAFGASASGYLGGTRYYFPSDIAEYEAMIDSGKILGITDDEADEKADYIMMRLRLIEGLSFSEYQARFGEDLQAAKQKEIARLVEQKLIGIDGDRLRILPQALFISNAVISELI